MNLPINEEELFSSLEESLCELNTLPWFTSIKDNLTNITIRIDDKYDKSELSLEEVRAKRLVRLFGLLHQTLSKKTISRDFSS